MASDDFVVAFASSSVWGKFGGHHACGATFGYIMPPLKYFSNSLVFKNGIEKEGLPRDSPAGLGAGGLRFKSGRPDQKYLACFLLLIESAVHLKPRLWNSGRQECLIRKSFSFLEFAT